MALELEQASLSDGPDPEYLDMRRRLWVSSIFALPLFIYAMGDILPGQPFAGVATWRWSQWLQLLVAGPAVLWGGWPFFVRAVQSLRTMNLNMFTLIGLGIAVAYGFSVVATVLPGIFPPAFTDMHGHHHASPAGPGSGTQGAWADFGRVARFVGTNSTCRHPHQR